MNHQKHLQEAVRVVPDFPKAGINFYDIASLLAEPQAFAAALEALRELVSAYKPDMIMGIEARGFLFAAPLAQMMELPMGMVRKKGKLPGEVLGYEYALEYGHDVIEVQPDLIPDGANIVLIDDLLATGGTMAAAEKLVKNAGGRVCGHVCLIELEGLNGVDKLSAPFSSVMKCAA